MAIWKEQTTPAKEPAPMSPTPTPQKDDTSFSTPSTYSTQPAARTSSGGGEKEFLMAAKKRRKIAALPSRRISPSRERFRAPDTFASRASSRATSTSTATSRLIRAQR